MNMSRFKILALVGLVDIIVCRPQEMKRENLLDDNRKSSREENNQNRNQEIIEDRSITTSPKIGPSRCARFVFVILFNTL